MFASLVVIPDDEAAHLMGREQGPDLRIAVRAAQINNNTRIISSVTAPGFVWHARKVSKQNHPRHQWSFASSANDLAHTVL